LEIGIVILSVTKYFESAGASGRVDAGGDDAAAGDAAGGLPALAPLEGAGAVVSATGMQPLAAPYEMLTFST
jgi:hypothetical protein